METEHYNLLEPSRHPQLCRPWHGVALSAVLALGGLAVLGAQSKWSSALAVDLASKEFLVSKELPLRAHGGGNSSSLLPVVMFHGAAETPDEFALARRWIEEEHPGTRTVPVDIYSGANSFQPLQEQLAGLTAYLGQLDDFYPDEFRDGYNLLCHSQGALVCRVAVQVMDNHRVRSLVSLAGPQMGVYGTTWLKSAQPFLQNQLPMPTLPSFIPGPLVSAGATVLSSRFYSFAYGSLQHATSLANLWHDPLHQEEYLKGNVFLPRANGEVESSDTERHRRNFIRLGRAVFLVGSFERSFDSKLGLQPWQTGVFGFYREGSDSEILPMEKQKLFVEDTFGLRSLKEAGKLHLETVKGVVHEDWLSSERIFKKHVLPHLQ